ncbi:MAG: BatA domain-containing protein [Pirellulales bacterium]
MSFLTPALIGGAALIALPIVLHLIMRRQPRLMEFPALRFVQNRRLSNQHRLRLRHLLLLALRCAIIALLAFALARPVLQGSGLLGQKTGIIATALVFDTSPRMAYQQQNSTRLQAAQELATWLLEQLPPDAQATVLDTGTSYRSQWGDRDAAQLRVMRLAPHASARSLLDTMKEALTLLAEREGDRRELYVFTDRTAGVWTDETLASLKAELEAMKDVSLYVIDVGADEPRNTSLAPLQLSSTSPGAGQPLRIGTKLERIPPAADQQTVELWLDSGDKPQKRGELVLAPNVTGEADVDFAIAGLELGVHQGYVRLLGSDPLPADDVRYFTVVVRPLRKVLLVAQHPDKAVFLREAIAPAVLAESGNNRFETKTITFDQLAKTQLSEFDAVCLLDPSPLSAESWDRVENYLRSGGGVAVFLGRQAQPVEKMNEPAPQLLPGPLKWISRDQTYFRPDDFNHPALAELADLSDALPWQNFPVFRYWEFGGLADGAFVVARFANGSPALVEMTRDQGRLMIMATPVSDFASDDPWNLLPTAPEAWPFLALSKSLLDYLTGGGDQSVNYTAGQTAIMSLGPQQQVENYLVQLPNGESLRQSLSAGQEEIVVSTTQSPGNYRVVAGGEENPLDLGFSVNVAADISQLARRDFADISEALGKDRVRLAKSEDEIEVRVGIGRVGRELFPWLITLVAMVLGAEQVLSNRFYRRE